MNLSSIFIERPVMTLLTMLSLMILGILAFFKLPVADLPSIDYPTISVVTLSPGASPETMASTIAVPLEKQFMAIQGIELVTSSNSLGQSYITLQFNIDKNIDVAAVDVQTAISKAQSDLPANLPAPPTFTKVNPSETPIMYLTVTSPTLSNAELYEYGKTFIGERISTILGVAEVSVYGAPYALRVNIDPNRIAAKGVTLGDVSEAIKRATPNLPSGQLDGPLQTKIIQTEGKILTAKDMNPLIIRYQKGAAVRIEDVGEAKDSLQDIRYTMTYTLGDYTASGVVLAVRKQPGTNTLQIAEQVKTMLPKLSEQIPKSVKLDILFDRSLSIEESVFEVELTLVLALILVVLVIYLYLGKLSDTMIPSLAMPLSIFITFWFMTFFNFSIDNLSLLALVLATGFIVDDAIVMLEAIVSKVEEGKGRLQAAYEASGQISFTILSMTLSLVAVFIPLIFMPGLIGKIFYEFSLVIVIVILASGFISLTLTPLLASLIMDERKGGSKNRVEEFSDSFNQFFLTKYKQTLEIALEWQNLILGIGLLSVLLSLFLFWHLPKDFLPSDDLGFLRGYAEGAEGVSPDQMAHLQDEINEIINANKSVKSFVGYSDTSGFNFIVLKPYSEREPINKVMQELYHDFKNLAGVNVFLKNLPLINLSLGSFSQGLYQYTLSSLDKEALFSSAENFIKRLKEVPGIVGVSSDLKIATPQINIEILRDQAAALGVEAIDIQNTLLLAYSGGQVSRIDTPINQYQIILELIPGYRKEALDLGSLWVRSRSTNKLVPLSSVARWYETLGVQSINHISQSPAVTIAFNTAPGYPLSSALEEINKIGEEILPPDVIGRTQGGASAFEKSVTSSIILFLAAIFAIYVVLGILYESFIHPLTILSSLPPAILGGLLTLWVFNLPLSLYSYLGLILLIGIVKKNGIMIIDYALDKERKEGLSPNSAIVEGCLARFRPIMMTTVCAIAGALPIAMGIGASAESRRPLGFVIIGGLLLSQLITLYLTPAVYLHLDRLNKRIAFGKRSPQP